MLATGKVRILKYLDGRLYDMTARRRLEQVDRWSFSLRDHAPAGGTVFPGEFAVGDDARDALVLVTGSSLVQALPEVPAGSRLRAGFALSAPGRARVQVRARGAGGERVLIDTVVEGAARLWQDADVEMGASGIDRLEIESGPVQGVPPPPGWLLCAPLEVVPPEAVALEIPPPVAAEQPRGLRIEPSPMKRGGWATIEVAGGEEMELDCQYTLDTENTWPRTVRGWLTTDAAGRQRLQVNRPGRYTILAIRNTLREDWVPVSYEWECLR
jgi:hypothetical protein